MQEHSESHGNGSITQWIEDLRNKDPDATLKIWNRFVERLVRVANRKLANSCCRIADGEVVAADAFNDFFKRSPDDFGKLVDRNDLWKILVVIAERRAIDAIRRESAKTRYTPNKIGGDVMHTISGPETPPDMELVLIEAFDDRLESLESDLLRQIAVDKMHGLKNSEIAQAHSISLRSVERKLSLIRETWQETDCRRANDS